VTPYRNFDVPEVLLSQEVPSEEVRMVPESPTVTNNPVVVVMSVLLEPSSLLLLQEIKMELKRRRESMMSMCFTRFPISGLGEPNIYQNLV
jgi:hypothetical protein